MLNFLYTNIGRGHPFYLDGIIELLRQRSVPDINISDVFEISNGQSFAAWNLAKQLYKIGSTDSIIGRLYNRLRDNSEYNKAGMAMKMMGRDVRKKYLHDESPLVVAHPVLVGMLNGKKNLFYQHGEIAVPKQAVVKGADYVFVPIDKCLPPFLLAGYNEKQLVITGLCIEPALVAQARSAFENRLKRITGSEPLTGAFFSSGAEPKPHIRKIMAAVLSVVHNGGKAIVFAPKNGRLHGQLNQVKDNSSNDKAVSLFTYNGREELNRITSKLFNQFDYLVSPSHERTNWALGLGLPMFILDPPIGPFAPLNKSVLLESGVAKSLNSENDAAEIADLILRLKSSGEIGKMAEKGWNQYPISGFQTIADFLVNKFPPNT